MVKISVSGKAVFDGKVTEAGNYSVLVDCRKKGEKIADNVRVVYKNFDDELGILKGQKVIADGWGFVTTRPGKDGKTYGQLVVIVENED